MRPDFDLMDALKEANIPTKILRTVLAEALRYFAGAMTVINLLDTIEAEIESIEENKGDEQQRIGYYKFRAHTRKIAHIRWSYFIEKMEKFGYCMQNPQTECEKYLKKHSGNHIYNNT